MGSSLGEALLPYQALRRQCPGVLGHWRLRSHLPLGRGVAAQFVGNQDTRCVALLLQQLAQQAFGDLLVASALNKDIENKALLVDRAPEPVLLAGDCDDDLVKVPFVAAAWGSP